MASTSNIPALIWQLRSRSRVQQAAAARALCEIALSGPDQQQAIVAAGGVRPLVQLLCEGSSAAVLEHAASALAHLASSNVEAVAAETAGMLPTLVRLLERRDPAAAWSAALISCACESREHTASVLAAGGVPPLVGMLSADEEKGKHAAAAAMVNLTKQCGLEASAAIAVAGGLQPAVRMLGSRNAAQKEIAVLLLRNLAWNCGAAVAAAGAIPPLAHILCSSGTGVQALQDAASAVASMAGGADAGTSAALVAAGVVPPLVALLSSSDEEAQGCAAAALCDLCRKGGPGCAAAVVAAGAVPALVARLRAGNDTVARNAASALGNAAAWNVAHRTATLAAGAIGAAQQALVNCHADATRHSVSLLLERLSPLPAGETAPAVPTTAPASVLAVAPPPSLPAAPRVCAAPGCGATRGLRRCGGCASVRYCSAACSRAHWRAHKAECRRLQAERAQASGGGQP